MEDHGLLKDLTVSLEVCMAGNVQVSAMNGLYGADIRDKT